MRKYCKVEEADTSTSVLKTLDHMSTTTNRGLRSGPAIVPLVASILLSRQPTPDTRRLKLQGQGTQRAWRHASDRNELRAIQ